VPIGSRLSGIATGPSVGPRYVDPATVGFGETPFAPAPVSPPAAVLADLPAGTTDQLVWSGPTRLLGWSVSEEAGAAAKLIIRDGNGTGAPLVGVVSLAAGESNREWFGPDGINITTGIYVDRISGTTLGGIYHRP
jgi:hypothetical protein